MTMSLLRRSSCSPILHQRTNLARIYGARCYKLTTMKSALVLLSVSLFAAPGPHWVATWAASPSPQLSENDMRAQHLVFSNQTLREIVHLSLGGQAFRLRVSNVFGKENVTLSGVHVAVAGKDSTIEVRTDHPVTFNGQTSVSVPANAIISSDPVQIAVKDDSNLAISILVSGATGAGIHYAASQTSYIGAGDQLTSASISDPQTIGSWVFLAGVDVQASAQTTTIVTFGDSITDGAASTVNANHRWPNYLYSRLLANKGGGTLAVVDEGIGGNRILHDAQGQIRFGVNALARFDRDVFGPTGRQVCCVARRDQ
jgi:hypothetical protein